MSIYGNTSVLIHVTCMRIIGLFSLGHQSWAFRVTVTVTLKGHESWALRVTVTVALSLGLTGATRKQFNELS